MIKIKKLSKGFTLLEMIVAVGLFIVVAIISLGTLLNISDVQRKTGALRSINDNINFSLETMVREIRSGSNYSSPSQSVFTMTNNIGESVTYRLNNNRIERSVSGNPYVVLTAQEVTINNLKFIVSGQLAGDSLQPSVTISINGIAGSEKEKTKAILKLQTTVTQRKLDS